MKKTSHTTVITSSIAIIFAASVALYFVAERKVRADLLVEAKTFAQEIDFTQVKTLSGTRADLETESYKKLKAQLTEMQNRNESIAFVYLAGIRDIPYREKLTRFKMIWKSFSISMENQGIRMMSHSPATSTTAQVNRFSPRSKQAKPLYTAQSLTSGAPG